MFSFPPCPQNVVSRSPPIIEGPMKILITNVPEQATRETLVKICKHFGRVLVSGYIIDILLHILELGNLAPLSLNVFSRSVASTYNVSDCVGGSDCHITDRLGK